jgi:bilin biosynthesis protein
MSVLHDRSRQGGRLEDLSQESFDTLLSILDEEDAQRRIAVAQEVGRRGRAGETRVIPVLVGRLSDGGEWIAEAASDALWSLGEPAVTPLVGVLEDRDAAPWAHVWAARTSMYIGDPRAVLPMLELVQDSNESLKERGAIAAYVGHMKDERAVQPLIDIVKDSRADPELQSIAADALSATGDRRAIAAFLEVLHRDDVRFHTEFDRRELGKLQAAQHEASGDMAAQLADMVKGLERGRSLHDRILRALRAFRDPNTLEFMLPQLATDDASHRTSIAAVLGDIGEPALDPLLEAMDSEDERVREGAAEALGFMADPRAIPRLADVLLQDRQASVRRAAASSLGFAGNERVMESLMQGIRDDDVHVRQASVQALYELAGVGRADARVLPALEEAIRSDDGQIYGHFVVRDAAARAVKEIRRVLNNRE